MTLLDAALDLAAAGLSVVPVRPDGSKAPAAMWKTYQDHPATPDELTAWFGGATSYDGLGVVCGAVSGQLEMLELEGRAVTEGVLDQVRQVLADHGAADLWDRIDNGYLEVTPSGGLHWHYRVDGDARRNLKLARRPATPDELQANPGERFKVLIETRGAGGFTVTAPSAGRSHPTGRPWAVLRGTPAAIPTISVDERDQLHTLLATLDQMPTQDTPTHAGGAGTASGQATGERPGDEYNDKATWDDILGGRGWTRGRTLGGSVTWTRPGKHPRDGISATTGRTLATAGTDNLYVFSSATEFDTEVPYSKFGAYALLEHHGDHAAAAKALAAQGYGKPLEQPTLTIVGTTPSPQPPAGPPPSAQAAAAATQGATVHQLHPRPDNTGTTMVRSEDGHAHQLINAYGDLIRYCPERGRWLVWATTRWEWQPPKGGQVREYAKTVARALPDSTQAEITHKRRALSSAGVTGALTQAETDARVTVAMHQLDADPWTLNTPAGPVDLRTGQLQAPDPASLCTKTTTVAPTVIPAARDPLWDAFLDDTFGTDPAGLETRAYVQRLVGLTLVGQVREQLLAFLHGVGANGKSTLAETLMHALGTGETGYAIAASSEMLMIRKHTEHPAELAKLAGARLVVCSELDDGQRFAEARMKQLTGSDSIDARFLYGQPFTFTPSHTIWLLGNHRPQARTGGLAFWRRVKLIEFANVVPVERRDPALGDKLNAAAGTVLAWAIDGVLDYLAHGLREPVSVAQAVASYAADQDTIGRFVDDVCHRADSNLVRIPMATLRDRYESWCREIGEEPALPKRLGQELRDRFGVDEVKSNGRKYYTHITILEQHHKPDELTFDAGSGSPTDHSPATIPGLP